jgi:hypothetical protein
MIKLLWVLGAIIQSYVLVSAKTVPVPASHVSTVKVRSNPMVSTESVFHRSAMRDMSNTYKEKKNDRIAAAVNVLNTKERIMAIAQMMGGTKPTEASILNATEMIHQNE